jgi:hypothetical protein
MRGDLGEPRRAGKRGVAIGRTGVGEGIDARYIGIGTAGGAATAASVCLIAAVAKSDGLAGLVLVGLVAVVAVT